MPSSLHLLLGREAISIFREPDPIIPSKSLMMATGFGSVAAVRSPSLMFVCDHPEWPAHIGMQS